MNRLARQDACRFQKVLINSDAALVIQVSLVTVARWIFDFISLSNVPLLLPQVFPRLF